MAYICIGILRGEYVGFNLPRHDHTVGTTILHCLGRSMIPCGWDIDPLMGTRGLPISLDVTQSSQSAFLTPRKMLTHTCSQIISPKTDVCDSEWVKAQQERNKSCCGVSSFFVNRSEIDKMRLQLHQPKRDMVAGSWSDRESHCRDCCDHLQHHRAVHYSCIH